MLLRIPLLLTLLAVVGPPAASQVAAVVGPLVVPVECPVTIALSNDIGAPISILTGCPFSVATSLGAFVYPPSCSNTVTPLQPAEGRRRRSLD